MTAATPTGRVDVLIVVDAGPGSGLGHASRCAALAHELAARGVTLAVECADPGMAGSLFPVPAGPYGAQPACVTVLDGYRFTHADRLSRQRQSQSIVLIDDLADSPFPADLVINQNLHADTLDYTAYGAKRLLAGPEYALLRAEFAALHTTPRPSDGAVLVTLGASELGVHAVEIANRLAARIDRDVIAVVGAGVASDPETQAGVRVLRGADMPAVMSTCRHYVGALGVSFLEALAAGLSTTGIAIPASQRPAGEAARARGLDIVDRIDDPALCDRVAAALQRPPSPVTQPDGRGAARVADAVMRLLET